MTAMASQNTSLTIVYSTVYSGADQRKHQTPKLCVTGLCAGNSPVTSEFPAQRASNAENGSIWWRHREEPHCHYSPLPTNMHPHTPNQSYQSHNCDQQILAHIHTRTHWSTPDRWRHFDTGSWHTPPVLEVQHGLNKLVWLRHEWDPKLTYGNGNNLAEILMMTFWKACSEKNSLYSFSKFRETCSNALVTYNLT